MNMAKQNQKPEKLARPQRPKPRLVNEIRKQKIQKKQINYRGLLKINSWLFSEV